MHSTENGNLSENGGDQVPTVVRATNLPGGAAAATVSVAGATAATTSGATTSTINRECAGCGKRIIERFLLKALDLFWHEDCLKCGCCDCRLGEVGSTLYTKANLILCKRDYLRLFGTTGYCAACNKVIPAFEMVMRAKNNVYHLECFACQQCNHRFCVGDRFYLCENKILCEYDYEERLVFANMAYNPSSLAHIRSERSSDSMALPRHRPPPAPPLLPTNTKQLLPRRTGFRPSLPQAAVQYCGPEYTNKDNTTIAAQILSAQAIPTQPAGHSLNAHRDDGSSGYGSPDSETFEASLPPSVIPNEKSPEAAKNRWKYDRLPRNTE